MDLMGMVGVGPAGPRGGALIGGRRPPKPPGGRPLRAGACGLQGVAEEVRAGPQGRPSGRDGACGPWPG